MAVNSEDLAELADALSSRGMPNIPGMGADFPLPPGAATNLPGDLGGVVIREAMGEMSRIADQMSRYVDQSHQDSQALLRGLTGSTQQREAELNALIAQAQSANRPPFAPADASSGGVPPVGPGPSREADDGTAPMPDTPDIPDIPAAPDTPAPPSPLGDPAATPLLEALRTWTAENAAAATAKEAADSAVEEARIEAKGAAAAAAAAAAATAPIAPYSEDLTWEKVRDLAGGRGQASLLKDFGKSSYGRALSKIQVEEPQIGQNEAGDWVRLGEDGSLTETAADETEISDFTHATRVNKVLGLASNPGSAIKASKMGVGAYAAYQAFEESGNLIEGAKEKGKAYQRVSGEGSISTGAVGNMAGDKAFQLANWGTMSNEDASALYKGAFETGEGDSWRRSAEEFGQTMVSDFGIPVSEAIDMIQIASQTGVESFGGLVNALTMVSKRAREVGVSAATLQASYGETLKGVTNTVSGAGSYGVAATTQAFGGAFIGGRAGQEFAAADNSGITSQTQLRILAQRSGMTVGQFQNSMEEGGPEFTKAFGDLQAQRTLGGLSSDVEGQVFQMIEEAGGKEALQNDPIKRDEIAKRIQGLNGFDAETWTSGYEATTGATVAGGAKNAGELIAAVLTGTTQRDAQVAADAPKLIDVGKGSLDKQENKDLYAALGKDTGWKGIDDAITGAIGSDNGSSIKDQLFGQLGISQLMGQPSRKGKGSVQQTYMDQVKKTGQRDPVLESLMQDETFDSQARFVVDTKDGKRKVGYDDLISKFSDQAAAGTATMIQGDGSEVNVSEITGKVDVSREVKSDKEDQKKDRGWRFWEDEKVGEEYKPEEGKGGGVVTITPSGKLEEWFNFQASGGTRIAGGRAAGTPPGRPLDSRNPTQSRP